MRRPSRIATPKRNVRSLEPIKSECGRCGWIGEVQTPGANCPECDHRTHPKRA